MDPLEAFAAAAGGGIVGGAFALAGVLIQSRREREKHQLDRTERYETILRDEYAAFLLEVSEANVALEKYEVERRVSPDAAMLEFTAFLAKSNASGKMRGYRLLLLERDQAARGLIEDLLRSFKRRLATQGKTPKDWPTLLEESHQMGAKAVKLIEWLHEHRMSKEGG